MEEKKDFQEDQLTIPRVVFRGRWAPLYLADTGSFRHMFGGPLTLQLDNWPVSYPLPHMVITLDLTDPMFSASSLVSRMLGIVRSSSLTELPLVYPFRLDGAVLKYRMIAPGRAKVIELSGAPIPDWPYANYPSHFPQHHLDAGDSEPVHWECDDDSDDCDEEHPWQTAQDSIPGRNEFFIIVPPNSQYGVSLWGKEGDLEEVQTIFRIELGRFIIEAWNECS